MTNNKKRKELMDIENRERVYKTFFTHYGKLLSTEDRIHMSLFKQVH